jgi:hypothetical protein
MADLLIDGTKAEQSYIILCPEGAVSNGNRERTPLHYDDNCVGPGGKFTNGRINGTGSCWC